MMNLFLLSGQRVQNGIWYYAKVEDKKHDLHHGLNNRKRAAENLR
jgi:hypothetical protein